MDAAGGADTMVSCSGLITSVTIRVSQSIERAVLGIWKLRRKLGQDFDKDFTHEKA